MLFCRCPGETQLLYWNPLLSLSFLTSASFAILDVVYNASNELVHTQTLVKSAIIPDNVAPFFLSSYRDHALNIPQRHQGHHHSSDIARWLGSWHVKGTICDGHFLKKCCKYQLIGFTVLSLDHYVATWKMWWVVIHCSWPISEW